MAEAHLRAAAERLFRRILLAIGRGRITLVDDSGAVQKLQIRLGPLELRDHSPRLAEFGFTSNPPPGSDAVALFVAGDRSNGVIIATGNQTCRLKGLANGEVALYDAFGQTVWLKSTGIVVTTPLKLTANVTGEVDVTSQTKIRLVAPEINIHATSKTTIDANGTGFVIDAAGLITTYSSSGASSLPTPPEVPT